MAIVYGFAGMRDHDGKISFRPQIPENVDGARISLTIRGQRLDVEFDREAVRYILRDGEALTIYHEEEEVSLTKEVPVAERRNAAR